MLVYEYLLRSARAHARKPALICDDTAYSYEQLSDAAGALSRFLRDHGLSAGDRVAIYLSNSYEAVVSIFGTLMAGGCIVPIGAVSPIERFCQVVQHCGATAVIAPGNRSAQVRAGIALAGLAPTLIWTDPSACEAHEYTFSGIAQRSATEPEKPISHPSPKVRPFHASQEHPATTGSTEVTASHLSTAPSNQLIDLDLAAIIYTSGSSGLPKGVTHTHRSIDTAVESIVEYLDNNSNDVILSVLQLNFSYGLLQLLATFRTGATLVLEKGFGYPYEVVRKFSRYRVTGFAGSPTIWAMILQMTGLTPKDFETVRYITNAAAAMPEPFVPRLARLFSNARIFLMHGLTECLRTGYLPPEEALSNPASIGRAMKNVELWIEDEDGTRLGAGETGELIVRGSTVMAGYWNDPVGTNHMLFPGRFPWESVLHTGDLFRTDERGYYYFVARKDDVIKSRGEKVSPVEVEAVIYGMSEVAECRIVGVPDNILGSKIKAEIVLHQGRSLDAARVKAHCTEHLEPYKVPHDIEFVQSLPKTEGGKIIRHKKVTES
jgi:long-chain acyl-CoA synthetase